MSVAPALPETGASSSELIACPSCDALHRVEDPETVTRTVCPRCHHVLIAPQRRVIAQAVSLSLATVLLLAGALTLPFLDLKTWGLRSGASVLEVALAFHGPLLSALAVGVVMMIAGVPLLRAVLVLFALTPCLRGRPAWPGAAAAFRLAERLRPWSMTEVFVIGAAVALVKLAGLATVEVGPAFFMFVLLVVVGVVQDSVMCRWSVWRILGRRSE